jgi:hypothetical protein
VPRVRIDVAAIPRANNDYIDADLICERAYMSVVQLQHGIANDIINPRVVDKSEGGIV